MEYTLYSYGNVPGVFGGNSLIRIPKFDMDALRFRLVLPIVCPVRHWGRFNLETIRNSGGHVPACSLYASAGACSAVMTVAPRATDTVLRGVRRVATPQEQCGCSGIAA